VFARIRASRIRRHVHPKARADTPPAPAPTGIDYLRLIEERHTRVTGARLQYAHLTDPDPEPELEPQPQPRRSEAHPDHAAEGIDDQQDEVEYPDDEQGYPGDQQDEASQEHRYDIDGHQYDIDLVALAENPNPIPDPVLEAELAEFSAYLGERRQHTDSTEPDSTEPDGTEPDSTGPDTTGRG
jgi:hypothetical protein